MTSIAIMNAKGGVGKSTLTLALAETLVVKHGKRVLLIDADGQMSLSLMLMTVERLTTLRREGQSLVGFLQAAMPGQIAADWRTFVASGIGDVDDAGQLHLLPGDMDLPLIERAFAERGRLDLLRQKCRQLLDEARAYVDVVLIDCAPGISVMTEAWLREAAWHLVPVKPDVLAVSGMHYLNAFKMRDPKLGFARHLGVVINMLDARSEVEGMIHEMLWSNRDLMVFKTAIPLVPHIQKAALFSREPRSYLNKYPGDAGQAFQSLAIEILDRLDAG